MNRTYFFQITLIFKRFKAEKDLVLSLRSSISINFPKKVKPRSHRRLNYRKATPHPKTVFYSFSLLYWARSP